MDLASFCCTWRGGGLGKSRAETTDYWFIPGSEDLWLGGIYVRCRSVQLANLYVCHYLVAFPETWRNSQITVAMSVYFCPSNPEQLGGERHWTIASNSPNLESKCYFRVGVHLPPPSPRPEALNELEGYDFEYELNVGGIYLGGR